MSKKKQKKAPQPPLTPENYFKSGKARRLPLHECLLDEGMNTHGLTVLIVARKHVNGNISWGNYLVDTFCLGLKDSGYFFNQPEEVYEDFKEKFNSGYKLELSDYSRVHGLIYGALEYAEDLGFEPCKQFDITQYILEEKEKVALEEISFGQDGKPFYVSGPFDDKAKVRRVIATLERTAGKGNFTYMYEAGLRGEEEDAMAEDEDDQEKDSLFGEGELDRILKQKQEPNLFQNFCIMELLFRKTFPEYIKDPEFGEESFDLDEALDLMGPLQPEFLPITPEESEKVSHILDILGSDPVKDCVPEIEAGIRLYPHIYRLYPILLTVHASPGMPLPEDQFDGFYHLFPDSILATLLRAHHLISLGEPERAFDLLGRKNNIREAFPVRDGIFSEDEIFSFFALLCRYYTMTEQWALALILGLGMVGSAELEDVNVILAIYELNGKMTEQLMAENSGKDSGA